MLAESNFYPGTTLSAGLDADIETVKSQWMAEGIQIPEGYELYSKYMYNITQPEGVEDPESIVVHVLAEGISKESRIAVVRNGAAEILESRWDGTYLVFEMDGVDAFYILTPQKSTFIQIVPVAAAIVLILAAAILMITKRNKRKKPDKREEDIGETEDEIGEPTEQQPEKDEAEEGTEEERTEEEGTEEDAGEDMAAISASE